MLVLGIDVALFVMLGVLLTLIACVMARALRMDQWQGEICVCSVFLVSFIYTIAYLAMVMVLDKLS